MTWVPRLGVNIDHVATVRNARGGTYPDPARAAIMATKAGADGITAHLREDRRHIIDDDLARIMAEIDVPLNLEIAATTEMTAIAVRHRPHAACIVPEKREERTTEGGLDAAGGGTKLAETVAELKEAGIRVSLFISPEAAQLEAAQRLKVPVVELHTGTYCDLSGGARITELKKVRAAAELADQMGIECHAGHGLTFDTVKQIAAIPTIKELNIWHFLIAEAIFIGLPNAISEMKKLIRDARLTVY
jgi:pyridoxine 5-phosphate synthase